MHDVALVKAKERFLTDRLPIREKYLSHQCLAQSGAPLQVRRSI